MLKTLQITLEDERLEPTAITHLERTIIFQTLQITHYSTGKSSSNDFLDYVPCLIFRGVRFIIIQKEPPFLFLMVVDFQEKLQGDDSYCKVVVN